MHCFHDRAHISGSSYQRWQAKGQMAKGQAQCASPLAFCSWLFCQCTLVTLSLLMGSIIFAQVGWAEFPLAFGGSLLSFTMRHALQIRKRCLAVLKSFLTAFFAENPFRNDFLTITHSRRDCRIPFQGKRHSRKRQ
jgi:hypothetical protein